MKIKKLHIKNFKSIADLEIIEPNPFTVFVGPNGSGKSNIFEALEFWSLGYKGYSIDLNSLFGGKNNMLHFNHLEQSADVSIEFPQDVILDSSAIALSTDSGNQIYQHQFSLKLDNFKKNADYRQFVSNFSRLFINSPKGNKLNFQDDKKITFITDNLEKVLKRILKDEGKKEEILDWLRLFIPEFDDVFIESSELSSTDTLVIKEKYSDKYFTKELISDGTYNILALLTAVFQSDEPQFLCIEEPENGLNPRVIKELVGFFRNACEEKGHYIWLNTHSQTLVSELTPDEIITVDKIKGETKIKQFKGEDFHGLSMDEAWLTNTLGGGLPW
ncbi:AAA family ATPase [Arcicella aquatica]|uniref:AAA family ATPase n=1 Tax=Arcicella aquatica TaxID=217141 RepID=A0ABU5QPJ9_9BACT|nr:AAA family ATPase [Arcicella aquatica]MEA5259006.1 AAA family ATPase [Arcicella aquatica]